MSPYEKHLATVEWKNLLLTGKNLEQNPDQGGVSHLRLAGGWGEKKRRAELNDVQQRCSGSLLSRNSKKYTSWSFDSSSCCALLWEFGCFKYFLTFWVNLSAQQFWRPSALTLFCLMNLPTRLQTLCPPSPLRAWSLICPWSPPSLQTTAWTRQSETSASAVDRICWCQHSSCKRECVCIL